MSRSLFDTIRADVVGEVLVAAAVAVVTKLLVMVKFLVVAN